MKVSQNINSRKHKHFTYDMTKFRIHMKNRLEKNCQTKPIEIVFEYFFLLPWFYVFYLFIYLFIFGTMSFKLPVI